MAVSASNVDGTNSKVIGTGSVTSPGWQHESYSIKANQSDGLVFILEMMPADTNAAVLFDDVKLTRLPIFTVRGSNSGGFAEATLMIQVDDAPPSNLIYTSPAATYTVGVPITNNLPGSGGGTVVSYSIHPKDIHGLAFNKFTGVISGVPSTVSASADYVVAATNSGGVTTTTISITVNDKSPANLTYPGSQAVYVWNARSPIPVLLPSGKGGQPTMYSVSPPLPAGVVLSSSAGSISGKPLRATPMAAYTVTATNSGGSTSADLTITVLSEAPGVISYDTPINYTINVNIAPNIPTVEGGKPTSWSIQPALPRGLNFDKDTGIILGAATSTRAQRAYTVRVGNDGGETTTTLVLAVLQAKPLSLKYTPDDVTATKGDVIPSLLGSLSPLGGPVDAFTISPALPLAIGLDPTSGTITGKAFAVSERTLYTITATNSGGSASYRVSLAVNDAPPSGMSYVFPTSRYLLNELIRPNAPTYDGGVVVSFKVTPVLPDGLRLDTVTGVIEGTPTTVTASQQYVVTAKNSGGATTAVVAMSVVEDAPLSLTYNKSTTSYIINKPIFPNRASWRGGKPSGFLVEPPLDKGLSLDATTGVISGTPVGPASPISDVYVVTANNTGGASSVILQFTFIDEPPRLLTYVPSTLVLTRDATTLESAPVVPLITGGANYHFNVQPNLPLGLSIDGTNGRLTGIPTEIRSAGQYVVTVSNTGGTASGKLNITVIDVPPSSSVRYKPSNALLYQGVLVEIAQLDQTGGVVTTTAVSPTLPPGLFVRLSDGAIVGAPTQQQRNTTYTVTLSNSGGAVTASLTITVVAEPPRELAYSRAVMVERINGVFVANTPVSKGGPVVSYAITAGLLPQGVELDSATGVISGRGTNVVSPPVFVKVTATNTGGNTSTTLSITVIHEPPLSIRYSAPTADYTIFTPITPNVPSYDANISVFQVSPQLPSGLALNVLTGQITGTPDQLSGPTSYTVMGSNSGGATQAELVLSVKNVLPPRLQYPTRGTLHARLGVPIIPEVPILTGSDILRRFSVSPPLPNALTIHDTRGVISGTATALSPPTNYSITVTNPGGFSTAFLVINVVDVAPSFSFAANPVLFYQNVPMSQSPVLVGGPLQAAIVTPELPPGLSCLANGSITGSASTLLVNPKVFLLTGTNSGGSSDSSFLLQILEAPPRNLTYPNISQGPFPAQRELELRPLYQGGRPSQWSVASGMPPGLSFDQTSGVIKGIPTAIGVTPQVVTASNTGGQASVSFTINVVLEAPLLLGPFPAMAQYNVGKGVQVSLTVVNQGGRLESYSIKPSLPPGLQFSLTTGEVFGAAEDFSANQNYTITATNQAGHASVVFPLTVVDAPPVDLRYGVQQPRYTVGVPIAPNTPITMVPVTAYTIRPTLTTGLSLNSVSGVISGIPVLTPTTVFGVVSKYNVTATNQGGTGVTTLAIVIVDVPPKTLSYANQTYTYTIQEDVLIEVAGVEGNIVTYNITPPKLPAGLFFNNATGELRGVAVVVLSTTLYQVSALNSGGNVTTEFLLTINDVPPKELGYPNASYDFAYKRPLVSQQPNNTGGRIVLYEVDPPLPNGLTLNSSTGVLAGTPTQLVAKPSTFKITGSNSGGNVSVPIAISVFDVPPLNLTYSRQNVIIYRGVSLVPLTPSYDGGFITQFTLDAATPLPPQLQLDRVTGEISGTPLAVAESAANDPNWWQDQVVKVTVRGSNSGGATQTNLTFTSRDGPILKLTYAIDGSQAFRKNQPITVLVPHSVGGRVLQYQAKELPFGLTLDSGNGVISGVPRVASRYRLYNVTASNPAGASTVWLNITVLDEPPVAFHYSLAPMALELSTPPQLQPVNVPVDVVGGAITMFEVVGTPLPSSFALDSASGNISVVRPLRAALPLTYFTIRGSNSGGAAVAEVGIRVKDVPPVSLSYGVSTELVYEQNLAISPLTPRYTGGSITTFSVFPDLPRGLSLNSTNGVLFGTPLDVTPSSTYHVTGHNSGGSVEAVLIITVNSPPPGGLTYSDAIVSYVNGSAIVSNRPESQNVLFDYTASPPLPPGLLLNRASGVITGAPNVDSEMWGVQGLYYITARNTGGSVSTRVAITVTDAAPSNLTYGGTSFKLIIGEAASLRPSAVGGKATSYRVSGLPAPFYMPSNTGVIRGTPTSKLPITAVTVTASNTGGSSSSSFTVAVTPAPPRAITYAQGFYKLTLNKTLAPALLPDVIGQAESFAIAPALPPGLRFNPFSGAIAGVGRALMAPTVFVVSVTNEGGTASVNLIMQITDAPPSLVSYPAIPVLRRLVPIDPIIPTINGVVTSFTVAPHLPLGLLLDPTTGVITGVPKHTTMAFPLFVVTAANSGGSLTSTLNLTIAYGAFRFGVPASAPTPVVQQLADYFQAQKNVDVTVTMYNDYNTTAIMALSRFEVDVVNTEALAAYIATKASFARVIGIEQREGRDSFVLDAVVLANGTISDFSQLRGKRACHGGMLAPASYASVSYLIANGNTDVVNSVDYDPLFERKNNPKATALEVETSLYECESSLRSTSLSFFGLSCAPADSPNPNQPAICGLCPRGYGNVCNKNNSLSGDAGALRGLSEGLCDVAFIAEGLQGWDQMCGGQSPPDWCISKRNFGSIPFMPRRGLGEIPTDSFLMHEIMFGEALEGLAAEAFESGMATGDARTQYLHFRALFDVIAGLMDYPLLRDYYQADSILIPSNWLTGDACQHLTQKGFEEITSHVPGLNATIQLATANGLSIANNCNNYPVTGLLRNQPLRIGLPLSFSQKEDARAQVQNFMQTAQLVSGLFVEGVVGMSVEDLNVGKVDVLLVDSASTLNALVVYQQQVLAVASGDVDAGGKRFLPYSPSVAWVMKDSPFHSFQDLQGTRSCHGGMESAAGTLLPVGWAMHHGIIKMTNPASLQDERGPCANPLADAMRDFFGASCAPPRTVSSHGICDLCPLSSVCDVSSSVYGGKNGAIRALLEHACEVTFASRNVRKTMCGSFSSSRSAVRSSLSSVDSAAAAAATADPQAAAAAAAAADAVIDGRIKSGVFESAAPEAGRSCPELDRIRFLTPPDGGNGYGLSPTNAFISRQNAFSPGALGRVLEMLMSLNNYPAILYAYQIDGVMNVSRPGTRQATRSHLAPLIAQLMQYQVPGWLKLAQCALLTQAALESNLECVGFVRRAQAQAGRQAYKTVRQTCNNYKYNADTMWQLTITPDINTQSIADNVTMTEQEVRIPSLST